MVNIEKLISSLPEHVLVVLRCIEEKGFEAYLVGGCVRDALLGRELHDYDIAASASPKDIIEMFSKAYMISETFGTVAVVCDGEASIEVTTFRADGEYTDGRRPDSIKPVSTLEEDLSRRDFTMNAIALSHSGELIDPFDGLDDIKKRNIRCVGNPESRIAEDALRMYRAFRFSAELDFVIDSTTLSAIHKSADHAKQISAERVRQELEKTLMSQKPEIAADIIYAGLLDEFLHKENRHSLSMQPLKTRLAQLALLPLETSLRLCAFCAILLEFELIKQPVLFLRSLRFDTKTIDRCSTGIDIAHELTNESRVSQCQGKVSSGIDLPRKDIKRMLAKHGVEKVRCAMAACDLTYNLKDTNDVFDNIPVGVSLQFLPIADEVVDSGECFSLNELAVNGRDIIELGQKPGVKVGEILNQLLNHVIEHPKDNKREILLAMAKLPGLTD